MKRPTLANDNMVSVYSGRTYFSPSSNKNSLASLQKSLLGLSFNSPKSESQKTFMFSQKPSTNLLRASAKVEKSSLGEQRKITKNNSESYPRTPSTSSTYGGPAGSTRPGNKLRGSSTNTSSLNKSRGEMMSSSAKQYSLPKYPDSLSLKDALLKQTKTRNLEIDTEIQAFKDSGGLKAYSTKSKDYKNKLYGNASPNGTNASIDYSSKYSHLVNHNSTGNLKYDSRTEPNDERLGMTPNNKQKNVLSKILSNTSEKSRSAMIRKPPLEDNSLLINQPSPNTLKINNFFSSAKRKELENSLYKKDKSLNISLKLESETGEVSRSAELNKKITNKVKQDHKATYKAMAYNDDSKDDFKKTDQDSKNLSITYTNPSMNTLQTNPNFELKPTSPSQKVSLNSFITKVEKGTTLPIKVKRDENNKEEMTGFAAPVKPYLSLEDKSKNESKTTTNADGKTITFSKNKMGQQALASSSQEGLKGRIRGTTPMNKDSNKETHESFNEANAQKPSFVYYMTSLEKHHKKWNEMDYFCQIYKEHFIQSFQALTFCKYLKPVDQRILAQKKVFLPKRPSHKDKKTVIFDLDETLIHCNESSDVPSDIILPIRFPHGEIIEAGINIRPYATEILKEISQHFEIIVFTASHSCYANVVLDHLDPGQQYIHHRLFRESCVVTDEGIYIKDLRVIGNRNLQDVVLVDNAAYSFGYQIENGIPVIPYYDNKEDQELKHLIPYLKSLASVKDVREVNKQTFKLHTYSMYDGLEKVLNKVVLQS